MNLVNLAHGSLYMVGAYLATRPPSGGPAPSCLAALFALAATLAVGMLVEVLTLRTAPYEPRPPRPRRWPPSA